MVFYPLRFDSCLWSWKQKQKVCSNCASNYSFLKIFSCLQSTTQYLKNEKEWQCLASYQTQLQLLCRHSNKKKDKLKQTHETVRFWVGSRIKAALSGSLTNWSKNRRQVVVMTAPVKINVQFWESTYSFIFSVSIHTKTHKWAAACGKESLCITERRFF